ncbi:MAG: hypothetical protein CG439_1157, partial [Methylococcaceae bacterium NSP1-2]
MVITYPAPDMALPIHEVKVLRLREQIMTLPLPENLSITPSPL